MNLKVANLNTQMGDRFVMKSGDPGVKIYNNVGVGSYASDLPSKGSVSAYIKGSIKEGGVLDLGIDEVSIQQRALFELYETVTFSDSTAISGDISTFAKAMSYNSIIDTSGGEINTHCTPLNQGIPPLVFFRYHIHRSRWMMRR